MHDSCALQFRGNFFIYGDGSLVKKLSYCELSVIGSLPFRFWNGACTATLNQLYLCFGEETKDGDKTCYRSSEPTGPFNLTAKSIKGHRSIRIAMNEGKAV